MFEFKYDVCMLEFLEQAEDLLHKHWEELALNKEHIKLKTDKQKSKQLQDAGVLFPIVVYDGNKIVGYSVVIIQPHLHYCEDSFAYVDVIYVDPEYRNSTIGARLLLRTEELAKDKGASVILHHAKPYVPMIIKPLEKLGYSLYEQIYGKWVG